MKISYHAFQRHVSIAEHILDAIIKTYQELNLQDEGIPNLVNEGFQMDNISE